MSIAWPEVAERCLQHYRRELVELFQSEESEARGAFLDASGRREATPGTLAYYMSRFVGGSPATPEELSALASPSRADLDARNALLRAVPHMQFVKLLLCDAHCRRPELVRGLAHGAVYTVDPSFNKHFIQRCPRGEAPTLFRALLHYLETGSGWETAGAANAFYWLGATGTDNAGDPSYDAALVRQICLERFVEDEDLDVRRSLVSQISWRRADYPMYVRSALRQARRIASRHDDLYIRARYACATGASNLFPALPERPLDAPTS